MTLEDLKNLKSSNKYVAKDKVVHQQVISNKNYFEMCEVLDSQSVAEYLDAMILVKANIRGEKRE